MFSKKLKAEQTFITLKMLRTDLFKKKVITLLLFFFVSIAAFLVASSANMIVELMSSLNYLFARSNVPHFVQMHHGSINPNLINHWASQNSIVKKKQIVEMLRIDPSNVYIGHRDTSERNGIMNIDFVSQNSSFDFLFNLNGQVIHPSRGEIAIPVYYMQRDHLKIGDKVRILSKGLQKEFTIVDFVRDALMNPSIIHSKRFLINPQDFTILKESANQFVYLIEFQVSDLTMLSQFSNEYLSADLPKNGPTIHYQLYKIINSITDGFTIGLITLISILLTIIAILSLRFTILTTMEEDYKEIGIMKAIGIQQNYIKRFYLAKYVLIAAVACGIGYFAAFFFKKIFIANIMLYLGTAPKNIFLNLIPLLSVCFIFLVVLYSCMLVLRKFTKISAVEALRVGVVDELQKHQKYLSLKRSKYLNLNIFLGLKDVFQRWKKFILLFFVFVISSFILVLPINFFNTIKSPSFMTFIGIGRSDMRIDMQGNNNDEFKRILSYLKKDETVKQYSYGIASRFKVMNSAGQLENINIESGDFSLFPIHYLQGRSPLHEDEIALSYLNSEELKKNVGDRIIVIVNGQSKEMLLAGIYQDVTNGGRTAKAILPVNPETILWYVFSVDFKPKVALDYKINTYAKLFPLARVTNVSDYLMQTLGDLINQIKVLALLIVCVAVFITIVISSLFLKLLVARHYSQIAIMKAIGFSLADIRIQYLTRSLLILNLGILVGVVISNTLGQSLVGLVWSMMGAPEIKFIINTVHTYIICPLILMSVVTMTTVGSIALIKNVHIDKMIVE